MLTLVLKVFGVVPAGVAVPGPVQAKVAPAVVELPVNTAVSAAQVIVGLAPALTCGMDELVETVSGAAFWQPFTGLVTVKV